MALLTVGFDSSHLVNGSYDTVSRVLEVTFRNGATYIYENITRATWNGLVSAASPGTYFWQNIR